MIRMLELWWERYCTNISLSGKI